mmetsp:Transcript_20746/g.21400  ORF Transcript_20746/g.21400 Transcript_20746/m.21400 type:complete len:183 (+) Transcript_20746:63-611(+)
MGNILKKITEHRNPYRVLFIGLDAAGKTTILYKLTSNCPEQIIPTIAFSIETIQYNNIHITAWDVGGRSNLRPLWRHYYPNTNGVVFVIDSNDRDRMEDVIDQFKRFTLEEELLGVPILVFANKADLPKSMTIEEITQQLTKSGIDLSRFHIIQTIATEGTGLKEGLSWLENEMQKKRNTFL